MRKNGSNLISFKQYRVGDLCVFIVLAIIAELVCYFAQFWFPSAAFYTLNLMLPLITLVIVRWGWWGVILAACEGVLYAAIRGGGWQSYLITIIGNAAIAVELLLIRMIKEERLYKHWYWAFLVTLAGWTAMNLVRACLSAIFYKNFLVQLETAFGFSDCGLLALVMGEIIILVCRRLDGLFENQKSYLLRLKKEREEESRRDTFGDEPIDLDEETLSILKKHDDMF